MVIYALIVFPLLMAVLAAACPWSRWRPWLLPVGGLTHLGIVLAAIYGSEAGAAVTGLGGWLRLDTLAKVVVTFLAVLFSICSLYAPGYLASRADRPNRVFCATMFVSLATMTLVTLSHHLGLTWVAMEATTLASQMRPRRTSYISTRSWRTTPTQF